MKKFDLITTEAANGSGISRSVIWRLMSELENCEGVYGCDLHSRLFNETQLYILTANAEKDLEEIGVFNAIKLVREYEHFNFGEFNTPIEPERIANMVCYIMGEFIYKSDHLQNNRWDAELTAEDLEIIEEELQEYLEGLTEDLSNVAFNEYKI